MAAAEGDFDLQLKLLLVGDSGVGKTCLLLRFVDGRFSDAFVTTIGIDFKTKVLPIEDRKVKVQVWDTAGQERFRTITQSYFRGAQNVASWVNQLKSHGDTEPAMILIANKSDMVEGREVEETEGAELADYFGIPFYLCSAKNGVNVDDAFRGLAVEAMRRLELEGSTKGKRKGGVSVGQRGKGERSGCC